MATSTTLLNYYQQMAEKARLSNLERQKAVETIFDEIIARYGPGGGFGKGYEAELEAQKTRDVGKVSQRDIGRGLYGIRPYEQEWESTVGAGARLKLEDIRMERLSGAQMGKASFLENIQNPYPDYSALMNAYGAAASAPSYSPSSGSTSPSGSLMDFMSRLRGAGPGGGGSETAPSSPTDFSSANAEILRREQAAEGVRTTMSQQTPLQYNPTAGATTDYTAAAQGPAITQALSKPYTPPGYKTEWSSTQNRWVTWKV